MIHRRKKGFSLVEMLVVIAIIAVLVSIVTPMVATSTTKAAAATNAANLRAAKGAFTTLKLMYPDDYSKWTGGVYAMMGITAENEEFVVSGDVSLAARNNAPVLLSSATPLTVVAKNAVRMKDGNTAVAEGTPMNAQILKNDDGTEEVYVTYDGLPISYFAEVAEKGTADADAHRKLKGQGNTAANKAYIDKYTERAQDIVSALNNKWENKVLLGNLLDQVTDIANDPASQGDCLQCAINNLNVHDAGLLGSVAGDKIEGILAGKGYDYNEDGAKYCASYTPVTAGGGCTCDPSHGKEAHVSTTSKINIGNGFDDCPEGGLHEYARGDQTHTCTKCKQANGKPCPSVDSSIPYLSTLIDDECMYCGYCACCAKADTWEWKSPGFLQSKQWVGTPAGYVGVTLKGIKYDTGVCMSGKAVVGGATSKGCGHTYDQHLAIPGNPNVSN